MPCDAPVMTATLRSLLTTSLLRKGESRVPPSCPAGRVVHLPAGLASRQVELPGHAEPVADPGELGTEPVVARRHQDRPACREGGERAVQLGLALALDEQRRRR